jgi:hypothetical protein
MTDLEPTGMGLALAAVLLVFLIIKEVVIPKVKSREDEGMPHKQPFYCQAGKYESRISHLESQSDSNDDNIRRLEKKVDKTIENTGKIQADVSAVREIVSWIRSNGSRDARHD